MDPGPPIVEVNEEAKPKNPPQLWFVGAANHERMCRIRRRFERDFGLSNVGAAEVAKKLIDFYLAAHPLGPQDE